MSGWGHFVADGKPGLAAPVEAYQVGGTDGTNLRALLTDSSGRLIIAGGGGGTFIVQDVADGTPGSPPPALAIQTAGTDGTDLRALLTDATGKLQVVLPAVSGALGSPIPGSVVMLGLQNSSANVASLGADNNGSSPIANRLPTIAAWDGTDSRLLLTDSSGRLYVNVNGTVPVSIAGLVTTTDAADGTPGSAIPAKGIMVAGSDGTNLRAIATDTSGKIELGGTLPGFAAEPTVKIDGSSGTLPPYASTPTVNLGQVVAVPGAAIPSDAVLVGGSDGTDIRALLTDNTGQAKVLVENTPAVTISGQPVEVKGGSATSISVYNLGGVSGAVVTLTATTITQIVAAPAAGTFYRLHAVIINTAALTTETPPSVGWQIGNSTMSFQFAAGWTVPQMFTLDGEMWPAANGAIYAQVGNVTHNRLVTLLYDVVATPTIT